MSEDAILGLTGFLAIGIASTGVWWLWGLAWAAIVFGGALYFGVTLEITAKALSGTREWGDGSNSHRR